MYARRTRNWWISILCSVSDNQQEETVDRAVTLEHTVANQNFRTTPLNSSIKANAQTT